MSFCLHSTSALQPRMLCAAAPSLFLLCFLATSYFAPFRLMWVQEESEVDMRLAKLGYSAFGRLKSLDSSSSNAFGGRRSPDSAHGYQGHYNSREPRVISATPINNPSEHERLGWSASGRRSPLLQAECGVLTDEMLNANAERKLYVLKLEELRDELIRRCCPPPSHLEPLHPLPTLSPSPSAHPEATSDRHQIHPAAQGDGSLERLHTKHHPVLPLNKTAPLRGSPMSPPRDWGRPLGLASSDAL